MLGRRGSLWFLAVPPYLWLLALFIVPLVVVGAISLLPGTGRIDFSHGWPSLNQYQQIFETDIYFRRLGISAVMAFIVPASATILASPIAYFLTFRARQRATVFLILLLVPFASSYLLRVMAWKLLLGSHGAINWVLTSLGFV